MLEEIKKDLADNFREGDEEILQEYIERITADALSISNRENTQRNRDLLSTEIKQCVKGLYLQRGGEGSTSLTSGGTSSAFKDCIEDLRVNIVKAGKRVPFL